VSCRSVMASFYVSFDHRSNVDTRRGMEDEIIPYIRSFHSSVLLLEYSPNTERLYSPSMLC